jgi:O-succinylbenzoate synthase
MGIRVDAKSYCRRFNRPLQTAHGLWLERRGLILRLEGDQGHVGYGEIAPIPWFGTESLEMAESFCKPWIGWWDSWDGWEIPVSLPATRYGFESAIRELLNYKMEVHATSNTCLEQHHFCGLLPAGPEAMTAWLDKSEKHHTWKWKIGVFPLAEELIWLQTLTQTLPATSRLRLDANGGLTDEEAKAWLAVCDRINQSPDVCTIEFLEQPMPPNNLDGMQRLSSQFETAIALDESVATLAQLQTCLKRGWRGWLVIKPAIAGSPNQLKEVLGHCGLQVVFSSVFETLVGRQAALQLALRHYQTRGPNATFPALGFGTLNWFNDDWQTLTPDQLWRRL